MRKQKAKIWLILEAAITVGVYAVWIRLFFKHSGGMLTSRGIYNLRYYTVLSNLAAGAASLCCVISVLKNRGGFSRGALRFRFVGSVMALTTFLTVALFFLPLYGWSRLYAGTNFWFHMVFPLLSVAGFLLIPAVELSPGRLTFAETLLPILPVIAYAAFYSINILINGRWDLQGSNDWYGFLHWGWGIGWCILGGIVLATWLAGLLLRAVYHKIMAKKH